MDDKDAPTGEARYDEGPGAPAEASSAYGMPYSQPGGSGRDRERHAARLDHLKDERLAELGLANRTLRGQLATVGKELEAQRRKAQDAVAARAKLAAEVRGLQEVVEQLRSGPVVKSDADYQREAESMREQLLGLRKEVVQLIAKVGAKDERIVELEGTIRAMREAGGAKGVALSEREHHEQIIQVAQEMTLAREAEQRARESEAGLREQLLSAERRCTLLEDQAALTEESAENAKAESRELARALRESEQARRTETRQLEDELDQARDDLERLSARLVTAEEAAGVAQRKLQRQSDEFRKQVSKMPARAEAMRKEVKLREEAERRAAATLERLEEQREKVDALGEEIAAARKVAGELDAVKAVSRKQVDTIGELRAALDAERARADKLAASHGRAADIKMKEHLKRREADSAKRSLQARVDYLTHKAKSDGDARKAAEVRLQEAQATIRELQRKLNTIYSVTGDKPGGAQPTSAQVPRGGGAAAARSARPSTAKGARRRPASAMPALGSAPAGGRRGPRGGEPSPLFSGSQQFDRTRGGRVVLEGDDDVGDEEDDSGGDGAAPGSTDPDHGVNPGGFQIARVGQNALPDQGLAVLPPSGDDMARRLLNQARVNSWLRRVGRRYPTHSSEQSAFIRSVARKLCQVVWMTRVAEARRMTEAERNLEERDALAAELKDAEAVSMHLGRRMELETTAKRKLLLQYLSAVLHTAAWTAAPGACQQSAAATPSQPSSAVRHSSASSVASEESDGGHSHGDGASSGGERESVVAGAAEQDGDAALSTPQRSLPRTPAPAVDTSGLKAAAETLGTPIAADEDSGDEGDQRGNGSDASTHLDSDGNVVRSDASAARTHADSDGNATADDKTERAPAFTQHPLELRLAGCGIGDDEVRALVASLRGSPCVRELDLRGNEITDAGARALGLFVHPSRALVRVDLRGNFLTARGVQRLAEAAGANDRVRHVVVTPEGKVEGLGLDDVGNGGGQASDGGDGAALTTQIVLDARRQKRRDPADLPDPRASSSAPTASRSRRRPASAVPVSPAARMGERHTGSREAFVDGGRHADARPASAPPRRPASGTRSRSRVGLHDAGTLEDRLARRVPPPGEVEFLQPGSFGTGRDGSGPAKYRRLPPRAARGGNKRVHSASAATLGRSSRRPRSAHPGMLASSASSTEFDFRGTTSGSRQRPRSAAPRATAYGEVTDRSDTSQERAPPARSGRGRPQSAAPRRKSERRDDYPPSSPLASPQPTGRSRRPQSAAPTRGSR